MKKRTANEEKLQNVVNDFIDQTGLRKKFQEQEILLSFKEIMGPFLMKKVKKSYVKNQKLFLQLSSAAFKQELVLQKTVLLGQLNSKIGSNYLTDLVLI
ncbi:MAG: DUF721 domain-containing protein [Flavobacteriales bacterium]|jgi:hypothetical protein|nr:DUF721 domain-containing protein [Flavobacteriales bacterium]MDA9893963.1 DUF721 domain-containing protein [bacterium]MDG1238664.1 DUF721 domain-containing protein [Flavobacteriales bacterium]MDG1440871.1 DUF721 domain-containing protein [Flavobacteriales bacterium]MDG1797138.1 DUF721 domain-containing protein [Flavobacteriales bacterium]|tara:strand:+ start:10 stop:306 length:297 start_codon:yes stop_codon:yes gene_type:complete